jgi:hypothetical protein
MDLITIATQLGTEEQCLAFIERMRWPEGVRCPICGCDKVSKFHVKESTRKAKRADGTIEIVSVPARHLYECMEQTCKQQFAATTGTLFHDTHLPLQKWFFAIALMVNAKKGLSARQMKRDLNVTYKTAWYLCHRIREAMESEGGLFGGRVEMDETYIGGRYDARRHPDNYLKQPVMGVVQRTNEAKHSQVRARS